MLMPSIFRDNFVDDFFDDMFQFPFAYNSNFERNAKLPGMNVDVQEFDDKYQMDLELPGYNKEDIKADLKDGYLTISANHTDESGDKDSDGKYIRRERYYGQCERSFYVGDNITQEDIHASFKNGVLQIEVPKKEAKPEVEQKKYIAIEG